MAALGFIAGFKKGFHMFGSSIATFVNTILLFAAYIVGVGITFIVSKFARKKFLDIKLRKDSYWEKIPARKDSLEESYKQYTRS